MLFGVPGAFTPTCSNSHLPGFLENHDAILDRGVDAIAVVAVNDHHVMAAWARLSAAAKARSIRWPTATAQFISALGLLTDMSGGGMGMRARRFSMIVDDGVVKALNFESKPGQAVETGAAHILDEL